MFSLFLNRFVYVLGFSSLCIDVHRVFAICNSDAARCPQPSGHTFRKLWQRLYHRWVEFDKGTPTRAFGKLIVRLSLFLPWQYWKRLLGKGGEEASAGSQRLVKAVAGAARSGSGRISKSETLESGDSSAQVGLVDAPLPGGLDAQAASKKSDYDTMAVAVAPQTVTLNPSTKQATASTAYLIQDPVDDDEEESQL